VFESIHESTRARKVAPSDNVLPRIQDMVQLCFGAETFGAVPAMDQVECQGDAGARCDPADFVRGIAEPSLVSSQLASTRAYQARYEMPDDGAVCRINSLPACSTRKSPPVCSQG
jgi:hypothetical protein